MTYDELNPQARPGAELFQAMVAKRGSEMPCAGCGALTTWEDYGLGKCVCSPACREVVSANA